MRVVGVHGTGPVALAEVTQGTDPMEALLSQGWAGRRPLLAKRAADGEIELIVEAEPSHGARPTHRDPGRDHGLTIGSEDPVMVKRRVAAYAVVESPRGVLATEYSDLTSAAGRWGLPGGGVDGLEEPAAAVAREVHEETSQIVEVHDLVDVHSAHWVGRSPRGQLEDYHAIRLVYRASCPNPTDPVVIDVGGTTSAARWVSLDQARSITWTAGWMSLLERVLPHLD